MPCHYLLLSTAVFPSCSHVTLCHLMLLRHNTIGNVSCCPYLLLSTMDGPFAHVPHHVMPYRATHGMSSCHHVIVMSCNIQCCVPTCCYPRSWVPMSRACRCWARTGCRLGPALAAMEDTEDSLASPCTPPPPPPQPLKVPTEFRGSLHNFQRRHPKANSP